MITKLGAAALVFALAGLAESRVHAEEIDLFNGKDFTGWTHFLADSNAKMEDTWSIEDGVIVCTGKPAGYIRTEKEYSNYVLTFEWRWAPGSKGGNSGCLIHMSGQDKIWPKSIEAQLMADNAGDIWNIDGTTVDVPDAAKRTQGRRIVNLTDGSEKALGEWNRYEITSNNGEITLKVNGTVVNAGKNASERKGYICLQSEGAPIHFRNIKITTLD